MSLLTTLRLRIPLRVLRGGLVRLPAGMITQVLAGRNDDYGDQPLERLLACICWNQRWLGCRTIFVEWNPPSSKPLLSPMLVKRFANLRCYVVSPQLHASVAKECNRPFLEYHAKNVGIRRSDTDWTLACNTDVIALPDCLPHLDKLNKYDIPRTRRIDFPFSGTTPTLLQVLDGRKYLRFRCIEGIGASAPGDFTMAHREIWEKARGYDESNPNRKVFCDVRGMHQLHTMGGHVKWIGTHLHFDHAESTSAGWDPSHGELFQPDLNIPYENSADWGLASANVRQISSNVWELSI